MQHRLQLVLGLGPLLPKRDPQPRQQPRLLRPLVRHPGLGQQIGPRQMRQRRRIDLVVLQPRRRDCLDPLRMHHHQLIRLRHRPLAQTPARTRSPPPLPAASPGSCRNHARSAAPSLTTCDCFDTSSHLHRPRLDSKIAGEDLLLHGSRSSWRTFLGWNICASSTYRKGTPLFLSEAACALCKLRSRRTPTSSIPPQRLKPFSHKPECPIFATASSSLT